MKNDLKILIGEIAKNDSCWILRDILHKYEEESQIISASFIYLHGTDISLSDSAIEISSFEENEIGARIICSLVNSLIEAYDVEITSETNHEVFITKDGSIMKNLFMHVSIEFEDSVSVTEMLNHEFPKILVYPFTQDTVNLDLWNTCCEYIKRVSKDEE